MACERNKLIDLTQYIEGLGVQVNIAKNKARGNRGIFLSKNSNYRIDISKCIDEKTKISTLLHEFAHYIHYQYDKTLKTLDFVFKDISDVEYDELLKVTVDNVPKDFAISLYNLKKQYQEENNVIANNIKSEYAEFKMTGSCKFIERTLPRVAKYLLKYDKVLFCGKYYSLSTLKQENVLSDIQINYIKLKTNQRYINRVSSRINKLNRYYNQPSELWARFFELYFTDKTKVYKIAPLLTQKFNEFIEIGKSKEMVDISNIMK